MYDSVGNFIEFSNLKLPNVKNVGGGGAKVQFYLYFSISKIKDKSRKLTYTFKFLSLSRIVLLDTASAPGTSFATLATKFSKLSFEITSFPLAFSKTIPSFPKLSFLLLKNYISDII